jgi:predicted peptidase
MQTRHLGSCLIRSGLLVFMALMKAGCAEVAIPAVSSPASAPLPMSPRETPTSLSPSAPVGVRTGQHPYALTVRIERESHLTQTVDVNYLLYLPDTYGKDPQQRWPLILFLHGSGGRSSNFEILKHERTDDFPFVVVSPQLPRELKRWSAMIDPLNVLLDHIQATYSVDPQRAYLTGLSMGGFGTWEFALRYPRRFAAIVPIAGGYIHRSDAIPENICVLKDVPVWAFHGAQDSAVRPAQSEELVKALEACGGDVRFTLYPDAGHADSWERAYADPEVYKWLMAQRLR